MPKNTAKKERRPRSEGVDVGEKRRERRTNAEIILDDLMIGRDRESKVMLGRDSESHHWKRRTKRSTRRREEKGKRAETNLLRCGP